MPASADNDVVVRPADDGVPTVPPIEFLAGVENGFADFQERRSNSHRTPVAQGALADLAAIAFDNFIERQQHWLGHMCPPCCPDTSGTKANDHIPRSHPSCRGIPMPYNERYGTAAVGAKQRSLSSMNERWRRPAAPSTKDWAKSAKSQAGESSDTGATGTRLTIGKKAGPMCISRRLLKPCAHGA